MRKESTKKKLRLTISLFTLISIFSIGIFYLYGLTFKSKRVEESKYIKIATFNIYRWGQTEYETKDYDALSDLIDDYDLVAIQEVMPQHGEERVLKLMERLGNGFSYFISPETGNKKYSEMYAFIYNRKTVELQDQGKFIKENPLENENYNLVPYMAYFRASNFDFWLVNVHLPSGSYEKDRTRETVNLISWIKTYIREESGGEKDLIIVGDFNRYGKEWRSFDNFLFTGWRDYYRILTLEPKANLKTNSARNVHKTYDNIFISKGADHEFGKEMAIIDRSIGVIPWDERVPWIKIHFDKIKMRISDHRPVWAKFRVDKPDDD